MLFDSDKLCRFVGFGNTHRLILHNSDINPSVYAEIKMRLSIANILYLENCAVGENNRSVSERMRADGGNAKRAYIGRHNRSSCGE